ncbi:universal stress protein UspA [Comamonas serinivorans]|uniref:Universal stress protein UspA n=1 Tax=Comamonas serinivorans TaxID=1082851 RepID=A0A1Y0ESD2_9BURK|nr:universal stress protein [Comamonas serinivorans]ARU06281.1 universal stress protein UspA [Comamonas serinivorans]
MFKHILVPIDGRPAMKEVLDKAVVLARTFGSRLTAVYVLDPQPFVGVSSEFAYGQSDAVGEARAAGEQALQAASLALRAAGQPVETAVVEEATAWRGILHAAAQAQAELIVMGSSRRKGLEKLVLGSVAESVLQNTTIPVFVVPSTEHGDAV